MNRRRATIAAPDHARSSPVRDRPAGLKLLGVLAFVLLTTALYARALLHEDRTIPVSQLVTPPELRSNASLMARHLSHLVAAVGVGTAALWMVLSRRRWRFGGLEAGVVVLSLAALLSVPAASDKRLALNAAIDTILPLIAAATLYQLLTARPTWRRVLLAAFVAVAAANCWKATGQRYWEYKEGWQAYLKDKPQVWARQGISLDDPQVQAYEQGVLNARPMGYIQGANVFGSFLLLGLAGTLAAWAARGAWPLGRWIEPGGISKPATRKAVRPASTTGPPAEADDGDAWPRPAGRWLTAISTLVLILLAVGHIVVLVWVRTAGSTAGLLAGLLAGVAAFMLGGRPTRLAIALGGMLIVLQTTLIVLALSGADVHRSLLNYKGAGGKIRTLAARLTYWEGAIRLSAAHPLTGVGPSQFGKRYFAVRPVHPNENPADAHNWLLNTTAEWGVLGLVGVLIALAGSGWKVIQSLARPPDEDHGSNRAVLLPAVAAVLGCWLLVWADLPRSEWAKALPMPMAVSLLAAMAAGFCGFRGRSGAVILLAGLFGFVVHCAAEITPTVPGVMWPFWGLVALAMAWPSGEPTRVVEAGAASHRLATAMPAMAGAAALVVLALTVQPMRAVSLMHQARQAVLQYRPEQALQLLRSAAAVDPLDPLPFKTASFLRYRLVQFDEAGALAHARDCVAVSGAAVQRDPMDHMAWRSLALANMYLATATSDFARVDEAVRAMKRAVDLNPHWPEGLLELARMAAVTGGPQEQVELLRTALDAADRALTLVARLETERAASLTEKDRTELRALREDLLRRLSAAKGRSQGP